MPPDFTPEQHAVISHIISGKGNLLVNAVAGSGKTTTVVAGALEFAKANPTKRVLMCAFNTRIKDALIEKIGPNPSLEIRTLNSLGHRALAKIIPARLNLVPKKTSALAKPFFPWGEQPDLNRLVGLLKGSGWIPFDVDFKGTRIVPDTNDVIESTIEMHDLDIDTDKPDFFPRLRALMGRSIYLAFSEGMIDYDDQIYLSTMWRAPFEKFPLGIGDEVQDLNKLQRLMLKLCLAPNSRVVGVGDRHQAIYAFRGAGFRSMDEFGEEFACTELPMTYCFRCPKVVVTRAQQQVPHIQAPDWAPIGTLKVLEEQDEPETTFLPTDVVLCRNTKPLVSLCYNLIQRKIPATILGREIGDGLIALVKKIAGKHERELAPFTKRLRQWFVAQSESLRAKEKEESIATLEDKVETLLCLIDAVNDELGPHVESDGPPTIDNLISIIEAMFAPHTDRLTLSTIHKAKGMEWPRVFFLDRQLIPSRYARSAAAIQQENNCIYVAVTRAQDTLFYVRSEDFFKHAERK